MDIKAAIDAVLNNTDLTTDQMQVVMEQIMTGQCTDAQIGGFLVGLRVKGETVEEITGAAKVMRQLATPVKLNAEFPVDIVGTGGDSAGIFNVSTASAFVAAAAGATVAKHGNRSVSSKSGSADLLEEAGVNLAINAEQVAQCIDQLGVGFMFAVNHHSAMKHAIGPRRELGVRTIFNLLGPLTNPAGVPNMLLGVYDQKLVRPIAEVMCELGANHVMVVHSVDGLDEISIAAETFVAELKAGEIKEYQLAPEQLGLERGSLADIRAEDAQQSLDMIKQAFSGELAVAANMISLNSGAAIYLSGKAASLEEGVAAAQAAMNSGGAAQKMQALADLTSAM